jgi:hypothetical protein
MNGSEPGAKKPAGIGAVANVTVLPDRPFHKSKPVKTIVADAD